MKFTSPDLCFHTSTSSTTRGQKRHSSRLALPRKVWKCQPHWLMYDLAGAHPKASARRELALGTTSSSCHTRGQKQTSLGSIPPYKVQNLLPHRQISGSTGAHGRCPAVPRDIKAHPRIRNIFIHVQLQQPGDKRTFLWFFYFRAG